MRLAGLLAIGASITMLLSSCESDPVPTASSTAITQTTNAASTDSTHKI